MPMVGGKEFPYTKKGMAAAKKEKEKEWDGPVKSMKMEKEKEWDGPVKSMKMDKKKDPFYGDKGPSASRKKMTDDPKALMADIRKRALKNRLKSKGMK